MYPDTVRLPSTAAAIDRLGIDVPQLLAAVEFDALEDCVLLSGSLVGGLGNLLSDLDIFVFSEADKSRTSLVRASLKERRWVDLQYIPQSRVREILEEVNQNAGRFPDDFGIHRGPQLSTMDLYHRLAIALPLTSNGLPADLRVKFDLSILARELCFVYLSFARSAWHDCVGAYGSGHYCQADYGAERVIDLVVDAYTALLGETYVGEKWRWARLARIESDPLALKPQFPDRHSLEAAPGEARAAYRMTISRDLLYQTMFLAMTGSSDPSPPILREPTWRLDIHGRTARIIDEWGMFR